MKHLLSIAILATTLNSFSQVEPCSTYTCDSLAVRAILDSNGINSSVDSIRMTVTNRRIDTLWFYNLGLQKLPPEIGKLNALKELNLYINQLANSLPPEIGQLTDLDELNLAYGNQFTRRRYFNIFYITNYRY